METAGGEKAQKKERKRKRGEDKFVPSTLPLPNPSLCFPVQFSWRLPRTLSEGILGRGSSFRIPSINKWYHFFMHSVEIRTFSRLFQSLKILLLALLGLSISFWNGSFPNPPFVYSCTSNSEIYAPSYVYLKPENGNLIGRSEPPRVNYIEDTSSWREQAIRGRVFFLLGERNSENKNQRTYQ